MEQNLYMLRVLPAQGKLFSATDISPVYGVSLAQQPKTFTFPIRSAAMLQNKLHVFLARFTVA